MAAEPSQSLSPAASYLAGCIAGSANIITGFPFDTLKVRLQHQHGSKGTPFATFRNVIRHQGVRGLYTGMSPQLIGGALECGVNYAVYSQVLNYCRDALDWNSRAAVPVAGAAAGAALSFVLSPAELLKCRMQAPDVKLAFRTPRDCLKHLLRTEGIKGLTRGFGSTLAREVPGNSLYFSAYAVLRGLWPEDSTRAALSRTDPSLGARLWSATSAIICGGLAGMLMWATILPIDVAKTRIQVAVSGSRRDLGLLATLRALRKEKKLYSGLSPTIIRAFPANAAQWLAWEVAADALAGW